MAVEVTVPRLGLGMKDGIIAEWYRPDGSTVEQGDPVYRLESDFVAFDVEAEGAGVLRHQVESGPARPGAIVAYILEAGERLPEPAAEIAEDAVHTFPSDDAAEDEPLNPFGQDHRERDGREQGEEGGSFVAAMAAWAQNKPGDRLAPVRPLYDVEDEASSPKPIPLRRVLAAPLPPPPDSGWDAAPGDRQDFVPGWDGDEPAPAATVEEDGDVDVFGYPRHRPDGQAPTTAGNGLFGFGEDEVPPSRGLFGFGGAEEPQRDVAVVEEAAPWFVTDEPAPPFEAPQAVADIEGRTDAWDAPEAEQPFAHAAPSHDPLAQYADEEYFERARPAADPDWHEVPEGGLPIRGVEGYDTSDIPIKDPGAPVESAYYLDESADPADAEEPLPFPGPHSYHATAEPAPYDAQWANAAPEWPSTETQTLAPAVFLTVKTTVAMGEARKMREQLTREWRGSGTQPGDEDIVIRAMARAATECPAFEGSGDAVGLVIAEPSGESVAVLEAAGSGAFRERVETLANTVATHDGGCACTLTSFARFGLDEGTPPVPDGHPLALGLGATREDGKATIVVAYAPGAISLHEAASFLGRVRELVEAPYALLAA